MKLSTRIYKRLLRPIYRLEKTLYRNDWLNSKNLTLPDFLCIGVQKSGSSWLHTSLSRHPEIYMPEKKELDFFGNNYRFHGITLRAYAAYFIPGIEKIKGEASPYCDLPLERIRFIKRILPEVKLVIVLRNPVDRAWSSALMHLIRAQQKDFNEIPEEAFKQFMSRPEILNQGLYPEILKKWRSFFGPSQLMVCFYDDLLENPQSFFSSVLQFLGVKDSTFTALDNYVNKSPEYAMPEKLRDHFHSVYLPSIMELSQEFGSRVLRWVRPEQDSGAT